MYCSISPCYFVFGFIASCTAPHFGAGSYVLCAVPLSCFPCRLTCLLFLGRYPAFGAGWPCFSRPLSCFSRQFSCFFPGRYPAFGHRSSKFFFPAALLLSSSAHLSFVSGALSCFQCRFPCSFFRAAFLLSVPVFQVLLPGRSRAFLAGSLFLFPGRFPALAACPFVPHDYLSFFVSFLVATPSSPRNNAAESGAGIPSASFPANPSADKSIKISRHSKRNHKLFFRNHPDSLHPSFRPSRKNRHRDMQNNSWRIINKLIGYMNYIHYRIQLPLHQTQYPPKKLMP